jgi:autotransporter-associated beta strand protein
MKTLPLISTLCWFSALATLQAGSATWKTNPTSDDWNTAANWTPNTVPNGPSDVATFFPTAVFDVTISAPVEVDRIDFWGPTLTIDLPNADGTLLISGFGLMNHSTALENIQTSSGGSLTFSNSASAGFAIVTNDGGSTQFLDTSTAASATLIANSASNGGEGGLISFADDASGGTARVELSGNGALDIRSHNSPGVTVGSLEGTGGSVILGGNNLTVGSNNLSTTFIGRLEDLGLLKEGGSLTKIGTGTLTLRAVNSYTGGTRVTAGTLLLQKMTSSGSQTGIGNVLVDAGILGGVGDVAGAVKIGNGCGLPASLSPGIDGPGTFTITKQLLFKSDGIYSFDLDSSTLTADRVIAKGVTIDIGARFSFGVVTGALPAGSVFTIIDNTAATPIVGNFSNLPDGSIFTQSGNIFHVSYEGGDGNDLTLTVAP